MTSDFAGNPTAQRSDVTVGDAIHGMTYARTKGCRCSLPGAVSFLSLSRAAQQELALAASQVKDYKEDPLNFVGKVRARTGNELLKVLPPAWAATCVTRTPPCLARSWRSLSRAVLPTGTLPVPCASECPAKWHALRTLRLIACIMPRPHATSADAFDIALLAHLEPPAYSTASP